VDAAFGRYGDFLDSLPKGLIYFADIPNNQHVFPSRPDMAAPAHGGRGKPPKALAPSIPPVAVSRLIADESAPWNRVTLDIGSKGPITIWDKILRVVEIRDGKPGEEGWLCARRLEDGRIKYSLCDHSASAAPEDIRMPALTRWSIEQCFEECKKRLGMDHYEVRAWQGWRRHILMTLIAHLLVIKLRREFAIQPNDMPRNPAPLAPVIDKPVDGRDYRAAMIRHQNNQEISRELTHAFPTKPQEMLKIGLILRDINAYMQKIGQILSTLEYQIKSAFEAFWSYTRTKIVEMVSIPPNL
jgi:hypothetical protein